MADETDQEAGTVAPVEPVAPMTEPVVEPTVEPADRAAWDDIPPEEVAREEQAALAGKDVMVGSEHGTSHATPELVATLTEPSPDEVPEGGKPEEEEPPPQPVGPTTPITAPAPGVEPVPPAT